MWHRQPQLADVGHQYNRFIIYIIIHNKNDKKSYMYISIYCNTVLKHIIKTKYPLTQIFIFNHRLRRVRDKRHGALFVEQKKYYLS
jgi:hypothetical protein